jgi:hypothetical protein
LVEFTRIKEADPGDGYVNMIVVMIVVDVLKYCLEYSIFLSCGWPAPVQLIGWVEGGRSQAIECDWGGNWTETYGMGCPRWQAACPAGGHPYG